MSDDIPDREKPKGFDISKLGLEMSDEKRAAADERLIERFKDLAEGNAFMADALRGIGGLSEAMLSANSLQEAINATEPGGIREHLGTVTGRGAFSEILAAQEQMRDLLPAIQSHKSALAGLPEYAAQASAIQDVLASVSDLSDTWRDVYGLSAASRLAEEMRRQVLYPESVSSFADIQIGTAAYIHRSIQALTLPRLEIMESLGIGRMADAFGAANVFQSLGLGPDYDAQMRTITSSLSEHMEALTASQAVRDAMFPTGLSDAIQGLLARSLVAQKAMLAEYRASATDAKTEARFNRRMVILATIINVLMFFMTVAANIEVRLEVDEVPQLENTEAVRQMQQSFDEMAVQVQRMNEIQEAASEQDMAADAAIADLLREIANSLAEQADTKGHDASKPPLED